MGQGSVEAVRLFNVVLITFEPTSTGEVPFTNDQGAPEGGGPRPSCPALRGGQRTGVENEVGQFVITPVIIVRVMTNL